MKSGKLSHAYLFVGPRGSGKTSTARILAQIVNCKENQDKTDSFVEPCGKCTACLSITKSNSVDVIEIDAASNGLVDDIRDLREKVRLSPVQLSKKVYIIDEVHMVSTSGFNALLKTLEEPPAHAIFILCTTEAQKVPETISSRCTRISFTKASAEEVIGSLLKAVKGEELKITIEALSEIAEATDGSFREGHKLLEQLASFGKEIDEDLVIQSLGVAGKISVDKVIDFALKGDCESVVSSFNEMEKMGVKATVLVGSILVNIKSRIEAGIGARVNIRALMMLADNLILAADKIKISPLPLLPVEMALLSVCLEGANTRSVVDRNEKGDAPPKAQTPARQRELETVSIVEVKEVSTEMLIDEDKSIVESNIVVQNYSGPLASLDKVKNDWPVFLNKMAANNGSLAGMLRLVSPIDIVGKSITLEVASRFQQEILEKETKRKVIEEQMAQVWGPMTFKCILGEKIPIRTEPTIEDINVATVAGNTTQEKGVMAAAEEIFGG